MDRQSTANTTQKIRSEIPSEIRITRHFPEGIPNQRIEDQNHTSNQKIGAHVRKRSGRNYLTAWLELSAGAGWPEIESPASVWTEFSGGGVATACCREGENVRACCSVLPRRRRRLGE
ncbi:hypothetical protein L2E82_41695 [Cichorium intybus]|uniref:Uncharacterized protein n=1 Tax=Cichorium intybus TaxID=13427 RepID=A0ACB8ZLA7_CICIN|nr:hypothetical protein L2E82_41695 [Cichorium intybus]